jgi:CRP/FNR family transcriptional regulator, cyclic AMP receptor protein
MDAATAELISHPLFSVLSAAAQQALRDAVTRRRVRRHEVVYSPGATCDATFWVRRGCIKVSRLFPDGREITLNLCHPGGVFGEEALVSDHPRACQAQALEDSLLLVLPASLSLHLLQEEAPFAVELARLIEQRRVMAEEQVENLAFRDVGARLALLLLDLARQQGRALGDGDTLLDTRLTHQELANCVGTTRETLTLTIDRFKTDGWIRLEGRMIAITEPEALQARAGNGRLPRGDV